jgi:glycine cleavage system aminomethyltransferase T
MVKDLQSQNGFLIQDHTRISGQLDRLLMPSQEEQKEKGKKWFEFWKK